MTQQLILAMAVMMTMMLSACAGNTSVTHYGGVEGNGYFHGGTMAGMAEPQQ